MAQAKSVVKNKFWVIEEDGIQIGTIQSTPTGVVLVQGQTRENYSSLKALMIKHNIKIVRSTKQPIKNSNQVYDYPCDVRPYNSIYDLKTKLPLYTKEESSKSYYCAGFYVVKEDNDWNINFCPKKIVISRHEHYGPFKTELEAKQVLSNLSK